MKNNVPKFAIAAGFIILLGVLCSGVVFVLIEYNLLSKADAGSFPSKSKLPLADCRSSHDPPKQFTIDDKKASQISVLTYHRIVQEDNIHKEHYIDGKVNQMIVTKEAFSEQMAYLKENDFVTLTLNELYLFLTGELEIPEKSVVLTFDDGYKDNFIEAYPLLKEHDFLAVNFLITAEITKRVHRFTPKYVQYFSTKEITKACDVFELQSHTYSYHQRELNAEGETTAFLNSKTKKEVREDIQKSIGNLDGENFAFAYPYGEYSPSTIKIVKELGFKMAFTTENKAASKKDHLYEIPRYNILADTDFEQFKRYVNN